MQATTLRHKHMRLDQGKLDRAMRILEAKTETEALSKALDLILGEAEIDSALRRARGRGRIKKVYR